MDYGSTNGASEASILLDNFWSRITKDMHGITSVR